MPYNPHANPPECHWTDLDGECPDPTVFAAAPVRVYADKDVTPSVHLLADGGLVLTIRTDNKQIDVHLGDVAKMLNLSPLRSHLEIGPMPVPPCPHCGEVCGDCRNC